MKQALVVGSAGQDGTLLSELLRAHGYNVLGIDQGDLQIEHANDVEQFVADNQPAEIYFLAAFHHSSEDPAIEPRELFERSFAVNAMAVVNFLDAIRKHAPRTRLFYAASSLIFGDVVEAPQTETTPITPTDAYGISKAAGLHACRHYRRAYGVHASVGILYNHESPLRADKFLSKKVTKAAWEIKRGTRDKLVLGNLAAEIDWGYAPDFVEAMRRIVALDTADDFIVATGEQHSVQEFVELAFGALDLDWRRYVQENRAVITRAPVTRVGDPSKLARATGWQLSVSFAEMVRLLIEAEAGAR